MDSLALLRRYSQVEPAPPFPSEAPEPAEVSVIIPTFNERQNLEPLVAAIASALDNKRWEIIIVDDDSPDGTAAAAKALYEHDSRVRTIRRVGRRGLASACVEGMLSSSAPFVAVIDGDLQHDPTLLRPMLRALATNEADIVIGSRYVAGGELGNWNSQRAAGSKLATRLAHVLTSVDVCDPMSGYFMLRREIVDEHAAALSTVGFKILLDILATARGELRIMELPLRFGARLHGESKMSSAVAWEFLMLLANKASGNRIPARFIAFCAIGLTGVAVHLLTLVILIDLLKVAFVAAQGAATTISIVSNFTINNLLTYADRRLGGWDWLKGLASFALICGFGAFANVGIAAWLFGHHVGWPLAALAGISATAVWNYGVSARFTWNSNG